MSKKISDFFAGRRPDHAGRFFDEILARDDDELESTHDYIQWIFPLREPSPVNPAAPLVDDETEFEFAADASLRDAVARAFARMLKSYGFQLRTVDGRPEITPSADWSRRSATWLTRGNHNMLRITRILKSLRLLGHPESADAFFTALRAVYRTNAAGVIGATTFSFWTSALR